MLSCLLDCPAGGGDELTVMILWAYTTVWSIPPTRDSGCARQRRRKPISFLRPQTRPVKQSTELWQKHRCRTQYPSLGFWIPASLRCARAEPLGSNLTEEWFIYSWVGLEWEEERSNVLLGRHAKIVLELGLRSYYTTKSFILQRVPEMWAKNIYIGNIFMMKFNLWSIEYWISMQQS